MTFRKTSTWLVALGLVLLTGGCAWLRPDQAARVATGSVAHDLCSETFISAQDPDRTFAESVAPRPGLELVAPLLHYEVDRTHGWVRASFAGGFTSTAVYREPGGCMLVRELPACGPECAVGIARLAERARAGTSLPVAPAASPALAHVLDEAFAENAAGARRNTKAVLILYRGNIVAERYAPGYGPDTPILGFSLSKSVTSALVGILVKDGKLKLDTPLFAGRGTGPVPTVENALRMTTGLDLDETGSGFDPSNHLLYVHTDDMAAFAAQAAALAPPGRRWAYSSATTHLLARLVRDTAGGAGAVRQFAQERLFGPAGMRHVTMETDATGTPIGAHYIFASTRDWGQFGLLYLHRGLGPDGRRLLPEDWVRWSTEPTLDTDYGAGWWLNRRAGGASGKGLDMPLMPDAPPDTFYGLGNLGQYLLVVPSMDLVIVRLGRAHTHDFDVDGANRLVAGAVAALGQAPASAETTRRP